MAETRWQPDDWCEQARKLIERGMRRGQVEFLASLLDHIEAGIRLRRPLDGQPPDRPPRLVGGPSCGGLARLRQAVEIWIEQREPVDRDRHGSWPPCQGLALEQDRTALCDIS